jgi:uncharacterized alkaline shock family protein YloU
LLLILELTPPRRKYVDLRQGKDDASVRVSPRDITKSVEEDAQSVRYVEDAKAKVATAGRGVTADVDLYVDRTAQVSTVTNEVQRAIDDGLNSRYGIRLAKKPNISIHYVDRKDKDRDKDDDKAGNRKGDSDDKFDEERERAREEALQEARSAPVEGAATTGATGRGSTRGRASGSGDFAQEREQEREKALEEAQSASSDDSGRSESFQRERAEAREEAMDEARSASAEGTTTASGDASEVEGVSGSPGNVGRDRGRGRT